MKVNKIIFPIAAASLLFASCDDQIMEWKEPDKTVSGSEIPMELAEKISKYDFIKNYMEQYHPGVDITIGMGLDDFLDEENPGYRQAVLDNFQGVTFGNAMKHQSIVTAAGSYNWSKVDQFIAQNTDLKLHGHNLLWHTQQQQTYMKGLIAPKLVQEQTGGNDGISNILVGDASDFEGGTTGGWGSWGSNKASADVVDGAGVDGSKGLVLVNNGDGNAWEAQCAFTFETPLKKDVEYKISFKAKSTSAVGELQFQYQNGTTYGSQGGYNTFPVGTDWITCEYIFTTTYEDVDRIILNFGKVGASYYIDDIRFGEYKEPAKDPMENIMVGDASDFEGGTTGGWGSWGSNKESADVVDGVGVDGSKALVLVNKGDGNAWEAQCAFTFDAPLVKDTPYIIQFQAKSTSAVGSLQFQYQNGTTYGSQGGYNDFPIGTDWITCEYEFTTTYEDVDRIIINFGKVGASYTIDNIKFGKKIQEPSRAIRSRAASFHYELKSAEEKKTILLNAMEEWIKEAMTHTGDACTSWDVINEPIGDNGQIRGVEGGWMSDDSEPVETTEEGLNLNWTNEPGNGHFYWGYYCGMDYAVKAFEYAAKYSTNGAKLFVNEYNLETNPNKLAKLIEFVNYIDANGAHVDGIGTQMHVSKSITKEQVDAMFKTLASTGKLIRITELDVALGTASPSAAELQTQSDVYQMILTSYFENIPASQQSAVTIWGLSDNSKEHEYWLKDESPNIFDASYGRKIAYKGVCDAIAGEDIGASFTSPDYHNPNH